MRIAILYATSHGTTEKCAKILNKFYNNKAEMINLKDNKNPVLENFDTVIIGGSIHAGQLKMKVKKFCQNNLELLKTKKLGIFMCCMEEGEKMLSLFQNGFPEELRNHADGHGFFGGEFIFEKMNFFEKSIVKKISKIEKSISKLKEEKIQEFVEMLN